MTGGGNAGGIDQSEEVVVWEWHEELGSEVVDGQGAAKVLSGIGIGEQLRTGRHFSETDGGISPCVSKCRDALDEW
jgi:hypothetical protein